MDSTNYSHDKISFSNLPLSLELLKAVADLGFEQTSPIQTKTIPLIIQKKDVIGLAQTGTGKTAAFGLPLLDQLDSRTHAIQALVLTPTRELAIQVAESFKQFAKHKKTLKFIPVYGGQPIGRQIFALRNGVHAIIATPGRLLDHIKRKTIALDQVKMVVLDEADEMLNMGFREDIEEIFSYVPKERQTLLFSATMSGDIMQLTKKYQNNPEVVQVAPHLKTVPKIDQAAFRIHEEDKIELLSRLIDMHEVQKGLIFVNTKRGVEEVTDKLAARGYLAASLHGDMQQSRRDNVMDKFRKGSVEFLVASDVAARGIDIDDIEVVFNYDVPQDTEDYVHRIGRTGRAGREGKAFMFVSPRQGKFFFEIERFIKSSVPFLPLPTNAEIKKQRLTDLAKKIKAGLEEQKFQEYLPLIEKMQHKDISLSDAMAVLIKLHIDEATTFERGDLFSPDISDNRRRSTSPHRFSSRGPSSAPSARFSREPMTTLTLNLGKRHGILPKDVVGAIAGETGINGSSIGKIRIDQEITSVDVPTAVASMVISKMQGKSIKRLPVSIEKR